MAYGNWGAFVYKNGIRIKENEDCTYKKEMYHAVLGTKIVLCGYKTIPILFINGKEINLDKKICKKYKEKFTPNEYNYTLEKNGYKINIEHIINLLTLELTEPNGTKWTSTCGFEHGAGFEND